MKLYKNGTGWKQPNKNTGQGWTYYEDYKVKTPGSDAMRLLQVGLDKGKDIYTAIRDMPITKVISHQFNEMARYQGEAAILRGEIAVEQGKSNANLTESTVEGAVDTAETIINETGKIPSRWSYHPNCLETFGDLCTYNEYNKRIRRRWEQEGLGEGGTD